MAVRNLAGVLQRPAAMYNGASTVQNTTGNPAMRGAECSESGMQSGSGKVQQHNPWPVALDPTRQAGLSPDSDGSRKVGLQSGECLQQHFYYPSLSAIEKYGWTPEDLTAHDNIFVRFLFLEQYILHLAAGHKVERLELMQPFNKKPWSCFAWQPLHIPLCVPLPPWQLHQVPPSASEDTQTARGLFRKLKRLGRGNREQSPGIRLPLQAAADTQKLQLATLQWEELWLRCNLQCWELESWQGLYGPMNFQASILFWEEE